MSGRALAGPGRLLAWGLCLLAIAASHAAEPIGSVVPQDATVESQLQSWDQALRSFRAAVWASYSGSVALGTDGRSRTLAQDLNEWVMTAPVQEKLRTLRAAIERNVRAGHEPAARAALKEALDITEEQRRLLWLISAYWQHQVAVDRQRDLWQGWLGQVPEATAAQSRSRLQALDVALTAAFSPDLSLDALNARITELLRAYNEERLQLAALVSRERAASGPAFSSWLRPTPCPVSNAYAPASGGSDRPLAELRGSSSPDPAQFYPAWARRQQIAGIVHVRLTVDASGCLERAEVVQSTGVPALDEAALDLCQYLRFVPAIQRGRAIPSQAVQPVNFKLYDTPASGTAVPPAPGVPEALAASAGNLITQGNDQMQRGDYLGAIAHFNRALELEPRSALAFANRGLAYFWSNDLFRAHADLDTAFSIDPNNAVVYRGRGLLALAASQFREAASAFTTALEKEAGSTFALHRRAEAYLALGKPSLALTDIAEIIHLEPQDLQAYAWRALIFRMQDNPDGSRAQAVAVMAARPEDPYAYALAASIYAASQAPIDSMRTLDQAVQRMPSENSFLYRAERRKYTDSAGARADIEAALQLNPQSERAASLLASLQTQSGAYEDALRTLSALLAREGHGSDSRFLVRRAVAYSKNHQVELAQKDLQDALGHAGTAVELNDLCWVLGTAGVLLTEALQACDEAIPKAVLPPSAIHDSRGFVLLKLARYPESIAAYDAALRINPFSADSLYGRGLARKAAGDSAGGEQDIRRAFKADASIAQRFASFGFPL